MKEFNVIVTPSEVFLIWYFQDGLEASIYVQINKWDKDFKYWQKVIERAIDVEARIG